MSRSRRIYVFIHYRGSCLLKGWAIFQVSDQTHTQRGRDEQDRGGEIKRGGVDGWGSETAGWQRLMLAHTGAVTTHLCLIVCVCVRASTRQESQGASTLHASVCSEHHSWLMSLKGQTPRTEIDGAFLGVEGNSLRGPVGHVSNMTLITTAGRRRYRKDKTKLKMGGQQRVGE